MPGLTCHCGIRIDYGTIPCPDEWLLISDIEFDKFVGLVDAEAVYKATQSLLRCPQCGRLWVFWDGFKNAPIEYQHQPSTTPESGSPKQPATFVSCRIMAEDLDPEIITNLTGLTPSDIHRRGDLRHGNPKYAAYKQGMWNLDSQVSRDESLEVHLAALLDIFEPKAEVMKQIAQSAQIDFFCTLFDLNGLHLPPEIMSRIARLGANLEVTVYPGADIVIEKR